MFAIFVEYTTQNDGGQESKQGKAGQAGGRARGRAGATKKLVEYSHGRAGRAGGRPGRRAGRRHEKFTGIFSWSFRQGRRVGGQAPQNVCRQGRRTDWKAGRQAPQEVYWSILMVMQAGQPDGRAGGRAGKQKSKQAGRRARTPLPRPS